MAGKREQFLINRADEIMELNHGGSFFLPEVIHSWGGSLGYSTAGHRRASAIWTVNRPTADTLFKSRRP
jgi:hypothetical protein